VAAQAASFDRAELGQEDSKAGPLLQAPSPLTPEMKQMQFDVSLRGRKQGQVRPKVLFCYFAGYNSE